jgi:ADP-heptose:LPS heptosyltransferase
VIRLEEELRSPYVTYVLLGRVGDALMATSFMDALRRRYPKARYRFVGSAACAGLAGTPMHRLVEPLKTAWVVPWTRAPLNLFPLFFLREPSQAVIDLNPAPSKSAAALLALADGREKVGFKKKRLNFPYTTQVEEPRDDEPMLDRYKRLAAAFDVPAEWVERPAITVGPLDTEWAEERLRELKYDQYGKINLVLHAGNFKKFDNRWPEEKFVALADRLSGDEKIQVWWLAGPGEREKTSALISACKKPAPLLPPGTLGQTGALLQKIGLLVGSITGTTHLASAVGAASFGLYSRYTDAVWRLKAVKTCGGLVSSDWGSCRSIGVDEAHAGIESFLAQLGKK